MSSTSISNLPQVSNLTTDFSSFVTQLENLLLAGPNGSGSPAWVDLLTTATGQTLVDFVAAVAAMDVYNLESAIQELYTPTAKLSSSIYAINQSLGVRLPRNLPASCTATYTYTNAGPTDFILPPYTQFSAGNGLLLYNRDAIIFPPYTTTASGTLYAGQLLSFVYSGNSTPFQVFVSPDSNFTVSDVDVTVTLDNNTIPVVESGIWNYLNSPAVLDFTNSQGQLVLLFGNSLYGTQPQNLQSVNITYTTTNGLLDNNAAFSGTTLSLSGNNYFSGVATSALSAGAAPLSAQVLAQVGPQIYAARDRAVIIQDYNAQAIGYPGVVDAFLLGPRSYAPNDVRFMNTIRSTILSSSPWSSGDFNTFATYMQTNYAMSTTAFYDYPPVNITLDVTANVYCGQSVNLTQAQTSIITAITNFLAPTTGTLSKSVYLSDIYELITNVSGVNHAVLLQPSQDYILDFSAASNPLNSITITDSTSSPSGTLGPGFVEYGVTYVTSKGESLPFTASMTLASSGSSVSLEFQALFLAQSYNIYRLVDNAGTYQLQFIGNGVVNNAINSNIQTVTFTDTGLSATTQVPPTYDQSGVFYVSVGTINLNMYYSNRVVAA